MPPIILIIFDYYAIISLFSIIAAITPLIRPLLLIID
jgi:hypothetical protein